MRRFIVAILCLILAAPIIAQVPTPANVTAQLAEQSAKREEAERKLLIREAADELEAAQTEQAYNRFEIWTGILMGAFSVLITVLVIVFGFRTEKAAAVAAKQEVASAKTEILGLLTEARDAAAAANAAQEALAVTKAEIDALLISTQSAATEAEKNASQIAKVQSAAAKIFDDMNKMSSADRTTIKLSPEEEKIVETAAGESAEKPEKDLTIDEYKARIGKAHYVDENWDEALRLAQAMAIIHFEDDEALAYALNAQGDARSQLNRHVEAIASYDEVDKRWRENTTVELQLHRLWAMHHRGLSLAKMGRAAEAEDAFRALLPLSERINGAEHGNTLAAQHELACAILDQGRADEAEVELQILLPLLDRLNGADHYNTLATRHVLARCILNQGRAAEAEASLRILLPQRELVNGVQHHGTLTTRHELARAILEQGRASEAETEFRILLPLCESADGVEHSGTLTVRHVLACAILEQNRTAEAEAEFRSLLPSCERVDGAEHSSARITRFWFARAVLENGDAVEAKEILAVIPDSLTAADLPERHLASLALIRARVADALDNGEEAEVWLTKALAHYVAAYPPDHYYRQQFDAYVAARDC